MLYLEKLNTGKIILNHFVNNAGIPLLEDDALSLNTLVKEATYAEEVLYAAVVNPNGIIKTHTDRTKLGTTLNIFKNAEEITREENIFLSKYTLPEGTRVLLLTRYVVFKGEMLGSVHLGLSLDFINDQIQKKITESLAAILSLTLVVVFMAVGTSVLLSRRLTKPISQLILGSRKIGGGNFEYEIKKVQNNELGDLASAFNDMAHRLREKSSIVKAFSPEILNRSWGDPEHTWPQKITRSQVTVLFAGVKGFKSYTDARILKDVLEDLNEFFAIAGESIQSHGGYVDKFIGDAVIGVFGSLPLQTDYTERAVRSAVTMQEALQSASKNGNQLLSRVGVGISSGVVLSGNIVSLSKTQYTFMGESFKMAYSLNVMAGPGEIIISKDVYQLIENLVSVEPLPPREIIGQSESWENFRLKELVRGKNDGWKISSENSA